MGRRRVGHIGRIAACLLSLLLLGIPRPAVAQGTDLDAIRAAIRDANAQWFPADNPVWRLPPEMRRGLAGTILPTRANPSIRPFRAPSRGVLPPRIDWRDVGGASYVTGIRDQTGCASCWAFASTATFESAFLIQQQTPGLDFDRSEQELLSCSGAGDCGGGLVDEAMAYLVGTGIVDDACFPYAREELPCEDKCRDWERRTFRARGIEAVPDDVEALKAALQDGPTTACMVIYEDFQAYGGGVYQHVWGFIEGNHAVELIGYDDAQQAFIAKNSYGEGWGEKGFFHIRYGDSEFGTCAYRIVRNRAPIIDWMPAVVLVPGSVLDLPIPVVEPDGDPLTWDVTGLAALPGATFDAATATLRWTPSDGTVGTWDVTLRASDDWTPAGTAQRTVRISACPTACDDGNLCTDDVCPDGTCRHPFNAAPCVADGNPCTRDACLDGACQAIEPDGTACDDDGNDCTLDECRAGACVHEPLPAGTSCGDEGSECTTDVCRDGACIHDPLPEGTLCSSDLEACTVDACRGGTCVHDPLPEGHRCDIGSDNPCTFGSCQTGMCNWEEAPDGTPCDDGDPCTQGETCTLEECRGEFHECRPTACQKSSACDGSGGCVVEPQPLGTACGAAWCDGDRLLDAPGCNGEGACVSGAARDCAPFGCRDGACLVACTGPKDCDADAQCLSGACVPRVNDGAACAVDGDCGSGHCGNGTCCASGDCCTSVGDCPAAYQVAPACDQPSRCQGWRGRATCTVRFQCLTVREDDDSACGAQDGPDCGPYAARPCTGAADQPFTTCATSCTTSQECDRDTATCADGTCRPVAAAADEGGLQDASDATADTGDPDDAGGERRRSGGCDTGRPGPAVPGMLLALLGIVGALRRFRRPRGPKPAAPAWTTT